MPRPYVALAALLSGGIMIMCGTECLCAQWHVFPELI